MAYAITVAQAPSQIAAGLTSITDSPTLILFPEIVTYPLSILHNG